MKLSQYLKTWEGMQNENKWGRVVQAALLVIVFVLMIKVFTKETIVTMQPFTLTEEAWVAQKSASRSYKEAWAFAFAQLFGNVTPTTVEFIKDRVRPFLGPRIYQEVIDALEMQARQIKGDRVSMRFEPRVVEYEMNTNKVFVYGYSFTKGTNSAEERVDRTYEFTIQIANYAPLLTHLETYAGRPRTKSMNEKIRRRDEVRQQKDDKEKRIEERMESQIESSTHESEF